jgi:hypothetical protein
MHKSALVYLGLAGVFVCSIIAALLLPVGEFITSVVILPGVGALLGVVWQIFRDHTAHERQLELKECEHFFNLSVTSHMAQVAFDKHAAFCEEYVARVNEGVKELFRDGPSKKAMTIVQNLATIRQKHAPWVTGDVLEKLKPFESAVWGIGTSAGYVADALGAPDRPAHIEKMYNTFSQVLGIPWKDAGERPEVRVDLILRHLQEVLGISELTRLRNAVVKKAMQGFCDT